MKRILALLALVPCLAFAQLPDGDAERTTAIDQAYNLAVFFTGDTTPPVTTITTYLNRMGHSENFLAPATITANQVSDRPVQVDYAQENTLFLTPATNTINTMGEYSIVGPDLIFSGNSSIWQAVAGGAEVTGDALSLVGAGPGSAGTTTSVPVTNDAKLTVEISSNNTIWGFGFTDSIPSSTTPTASNVNYFAQLGVDSCFDILSNGVTQQSNAVCGVVNANLASWEIDQTLERAVFIYDGTVYHTIDNGGAFNTLYGAAVITTADSAALDNGILDSDLQTLTTINPLWSILTDQTVNGLDTSKDAGGSNSAATSTRAILQGDDAVLSFILDTSSSARVGFSSTNTGIVTSNIDFAAAYVSDTLRTYESGTVAANVGADTDGTVIEVRLTDGVFTAYRDGVLYDTSAVVPTYPLYPVNFIITDGDAVRNATLTINDNLQTFQSTLWGDDGDAWTATGETEELPDFSYAGYKAGEEAIPANTATDINVTSAPYNAIPDDSIDDTAAFTAAFAAATAGQTIYVPNGVYNVDFLKIDDKGDWVLRGESEAGAVLYMDTPLSQQGLASIDGGDSTYWQFQGGLIWVDGNNPADGTTLLEDISVNAVRGTKNITTATDISGSITAGDWVQVVAYDPASGGAQGDLQQEIYKGLTYTEVAELLGDQMLKFPTRVEAVSGTTVTLERPLPIDINTAWTPELHLYSPEVENVGIQDLTIQAVLDPYAGHATAEGYNGIQLDGCSDCYVKSVTFINLDYGVHVGQDTAFTTIDDIDIEVNASRGSPYSGHHAFTFDQAQDNLITNVTFNGVSYVHDLTLTNYARGNVYSKITGPNINFDNHRMGNYQNGLTEINVGNPDRFLASGGTSDRGPHAGQRNTFWGVTGTNGLIFDTETCGFGGGYLNFVGVNTTSNCVADNWHADSERFISPAGLDPVNIHDDQVLHLLPNRPSYNTLTQAPGGFFEDLNRYATNAVRTQTETEINSILPAANAVGFFNFPAPYNTLGFRATNSQSGEPYGYSNWQKVCPRPSDPNIIDLLSSESDGVYHIVANATTQSITNNGLVLPVGDSQRAFHGEHWFWDSSCNQKFYFLNGTEIKSYTIGDANSVVLWDATTDYPTATSLTQPYASDDTDSDGIADVFVATINYAGSTNAVVWRESDGETFEHVVTGTYDEVAVDKSGTIFLVKEELPPLDADQHDNIIYDLQGVSDLSTLTIKYTHLDTDGAGGHLDMGWRTSVTSDNNDSNSCNVVKEWDYNQTNYTNFLANSGGTSFIHATNAECDVEIPEHISFQNAVDTATTPMFDQFFAGSSENLNNRWLSDEIWLKLTDPADPRVLVLAPNMTETDTESGGATDYFNAPKGSTDPTGNWFCWDANLGYTGANDFTSDLLCVQIPHHKFDEAIQPVIAYDSGEFDENVADDGTISNSLTINLSFDTFATVGALSFGTHFNASNVPLGLTLAVTSTNGVTATASLTGTATDHDDSDDISNLELAFLDAAFTASTAAQVTGSTKSDIVVDFIGTGPPATIMGRPECPAGVLTDPTDTGCARLIAGLDPLDDDDVVIYAGKTPGTTDDFFVRRCDYGQLWDDVSACTGTPLAASWKSINNDSATAIIAFDANPSDAGAADGFANTALLVADATGTHQAAEVCEAIGTGWFDPGISQLDIIYHNLVGTDDPDHPLATVGNGGTTNSGTTGPLRASFDTASGFYYQASSESSLTQNWMQRMTDGHQSFANTKTTGRSLRCAYQDTGAQASINYGSDTFNEAVADNGTIDNSLTLNLTGDTFDTIGTLAVNTDYIANGVPAGLTPSVVTSDSTTAAFSLTGTASSHDNADDINDLELIFQNDAFTSNDASSITNSAKLDISVDFIESSPTPTITYSSSTFNESIGNDGSITNTLTLTLTNDTYVITGGAMTASTHYTAANVPAGLTVVVTGTSSTTATFTLTGTATAHADANDISNLTLTFLDAAFTTSTAAQVTNAIRSDLVVDFIDSGQASTQEQLFQLNRSVVIDTNCPLVTAYNWAAPFVDWDGTAGIDAIVYEHHTDPSDLLHQACIIPNGSSTPAPYTWDFGARAPLMLDDDDDGDLDAIGTEGGGIYDFYFENNGNGTFTIGSAQTPVLSEFTDFELMADLLPATGGAHPCAHRPGNNLLADLDGDGDNERIINYTGCFDRSPIEDNPRVPFIFEHDGDDWINVTSDLVTLTNGLGMLYPVDVDVDSDIDLVNPVLGVWYSNDGSGNFDSGNTIFTTVPDPLTAGDLGAFSTDEHLRFHDLDNNGYLDMLIMGDHKRIGTIWMNNAGTFTQLTGSIFGTNGREAWFGDADSDGDLDLYVYQENGAGGRTVHFYDNVTTNSGVFVDVGSLDNDHILLNGVYSVPQNEGYRQSLASVSDDVVHVGNQSSAPALVVVTKTTAGAQTEPANFSSVWRNADLTDIDMDRHIMISESTTASAEGNLNTPIANNAELEFTIEDITTQGGVCFKDPGDASTLANCEHGIILTATSQLNYIQNGVVDTSNISSGSVANDVLVTLVKNADSSEFEISLDSVVVFTETGVTYSNNLVPMAFVTEAGDFINNTTYNNTHSIAAISSSLRLYANNTTINPDLNSNVTSTSTEIVTVGVPFAACQLFSSNDFRLLDDGASEVSVYVETSLNWPDTKSCAQTSIRALKVQFEFDATGASPVDYTWDLQGRTLADRTEVAVSEVAHDDAIKDGVMEPRVFAINDNAYLVNTGLSPPTLAADSSDHDTGYWPNLFNDYAETFNYSTSSYTNWLFDRASMVYRQAVRSEDILQYREAYNSHEFYINHIEVTGANTTVVDYCIGGWDYGGRADTLGSGGGGCDSKYVYAENMLLHLALTGDDSWQPSDNGTPVASLVDREDVFLEMADLLYAGTNRCPGTGSCQSPTVPPAGFSEAYDGVEDVFTERKSGLGLQTMLAVCQLTLSTTVCGQVDTIVNNLSAMQTANPDGLGDLGYLGHSLYLHEGGFLPWVGTLEQNYTNQTSIDIVNTIATFPSDLSSGNTVRVGATDSVLSAAPVDNLDGTWTLSLNTAVSGSTGDLVRSSYIAGTSGALNFDMTTDRIFSPWMQSNLADGLWNYYWWTDNQAQKDKASALLRGFGNSIAAYGVDKTRLVAATETEIESAYGVTVFDSGIVSTTCGSFLTTSPYFRYFASDFMGTETINTAFTGSIFSTGGFSDQHTPEAIFQLALGAYFETNTTRRDAMWSVITDALDWFASHACTVDLVAYPPRAINWQEKPDPYGTYAWVKNELGL